VKGNSEKRGTIAWFSGLLIFIAGVPSALSFGVWSEIQIAGKSIFDFADFLTSNIALPLGALFISLFVAYRLPRQLVKEELSLGAPGIGVLFDVWYFSIRFVVPIGILFVFLRSLGFL
jgi:NSS family neurotransmitter:Na+ symporter